MPHPSTHPRGSRYRLAIILTGSLVLLAYATLNVLLRFGWAEGKVRKELSRAVAVASDGAYTLEFESLSFSLGLQNVYLQNLELHPVAIRDSVRLIRRANLRSFEIHNVHWLRTIFREPAVEAIEIHAPDLDLTLDFLREGADSTASTGRGPDLTIDGAVGTVRLLGGAVSVRAQTPDGIVLTKLHDVDIHVRDLGSDWTRPPGYILATADVLASVGSAQVAIDDSLLSFDLTDVTASNLEARMEVGGFRVSPTLSDSAFGARLEYRQDRIDIGVRGAVISGADFAGVLRDGALRAEVVVVDSFGIDVLSDKRIPARPRSTPSVFLTEQIRDAGFPIKIDSIEVRDGVIRYREHGVNSDQPATVSFESISGSIVHLVNSAADADSTTPLKARLNGMLLGSVPVYAELEVPVRSSSSDLSFHASGGASQATTFNDITIPLEGLEFVSGDLDTLFLEGAATNGRVTGAVRMTYRDLRIRTVDRNSRTQNLGQAITSAVGNLIYVRRNNVSGGNQPVRIGDLSHLRGPGDSLWGFLWYSVRSGLLSVVIQGR